MFKKMIQKIQEEGVDLPKNPPPIVKNVTSPSTSRREIVEATPLKQPVNPKGLPFRNEMSNNSHRTDNSKHSNSESTHEDITMLAASLAEKEDLLMAKIQNEEKLKAIWEKQQDLMLQRVEKKEKEWKAKVEAMEDEKGKLLSRLHEAEVLKDKFFQKQEDIEEFEGFQMQEMAKVKHLLLLSQQELLRTQELLTKQEIEAEVAKQKVTEMETYVAKLEANIQKLDVEKSEFQQVAEQHENSVTEMKAAQQVQDKTIHELLVETEGAKSKAAQLAEKCATLQDDYDALLHKHEVHFNKSESELEEKCNFIKHLEDRIVTLDRRLGDITMGDDERLQALMMERDALETKAEEYRQHLNEMKTSLSEKISLLERQISHLNIKIIEDADEAAQQERDAVIDKTNLETKVSDLMDQVAQLLVDLKDTEQRFKDKDEELKNLKMKHGSDIQEAYASKEEACHLLNENIRGLEARISTMDVDREKEIGEYQSNIVQLEGRHTELQKQTERHIEEKIRIETDLKSTQEDVRNLQQILERLQLECEVKQSQLTEKTNEAEATRESFTSCQTHLTKIEVELRLCKLERDELMVRNAELSHQLELLRQSALEEQRRNEEFVKAENERFHEMSSTLIGCQEANKKLQDRVGDLQNAANLDVEKFDRTIEYQSTIKELENQLQDKIKTIKLQQQRISDIKKTLQKELKMQSVSNDLGMGESVDKTTAGIKMAPSHITIYGHPKPCSLSEKLDDINFKYLKHVMMKFMTSTEYEAQHLIKAIAVLLEFTIEEESLVRKTLEWKTSWFGAKPQPCRGHTHEH